MAIAEVKRVPKFDYMMLSRLQCDCEYYLHYGNRNPRSLWAGDEKAHIAEMKRLYYNMPYHQRPCWLSETRLKYYEKKMVQ